MIAVVSVGGKVRGKLGQVRIRETNDREPSLTRRKAEDVVETGVARLPRDESVGELDSGQAATGVEKA
jgi:hypothetical protein